MYCKVLKVDSLNLDYKNDFMQQTIIDGYAKLLNSLQIPIEIVCKGDDMNDDINIKDIKLKKFLDEHIKKSKIINKTFYIVIKHHNSNLIDINLEIIKKCLKNMNLYSEEIDMNNKYNFYQIDSIEKNYIKYNNKFYKTMWIYNWPYNASPGWLEFLYNLNINIDIHSYIYPQNTYKSIKMLRKRLCQYGSSEILEENNTGENDIYKPEIDSIYTMMDELKNNAGKFFMMSFYITIKGNTKEDLENNYKKIKMELYSKGIECYDGYLNEYKTIDNFNGNDTFKKYYNFTTSSLKTFIPFLSYNLYDKKGVYFAENIQNNSLIFLDLFKRQYAIILAIGLMGSGKSFVIKNFVKNEAEKGTQITIFDKSGEYSELNSNNNIKIYCNKNYKEYLNLLRQYVNNVDNDYVNKKSIPRLFVCDEICDYLNSDCGEEFSELFDKIILQGRKKYLAFCAIIQNIEMLSQNKTFGNNILKVANIIILMKMQINEAAIVAKEFYLNDKQINYLATADHEGLLIVNYNCLQFKVKIDKYDEMLFNTNPLLEGE